MQMWMIEARLMKLEASRYPGLAHRFANVPLEQVPVLYAFFFGPPRKTTARLNVNVL